MCGRFPHRRHHQEHPRSRGENNSGSAATVPSKGTSPLTRGKYRVVHLAIPAHGNIPAHAGKIFRKRLPFACQPEHPRSRGENVQAASQWGGVVGTSPLTRGKCNHPSGTASQSRNIPAHAGKIHTRQWRGQGRPEHPRSRGENYPGLPHQAAACGTSPLTRGKFSVAIMVGECCRNIPAHAGKMLGVVETV